MRVLVFEPGHTGHHLHHVRLLAGALADLGLEVALTLDSTAPGTQEFKVHLGAVAERVSVDASVPPIEGQLIRHALRRVRALQGAVKRHRPEHVYVPYGDGLSQVLGIARAFGQRLLPRGVEAETLLMRGGFAYPRRDRRRDHVRDLASLTATEWAPWTVVHHLDPVRFEAIVRRGGDLAARSRLIPEPVEPIARLDRVTARRRLGLPEDGRYAGTVGLLHRRKGIDLLVRAFSAMAARVPDARLLLMGRVKPPMDAVLAAEPLVKAGRIVVVDRYVSDEELGAALSAMDVVCAPHPRHIGSSGIVVRAAAANRQVLGSSFGWIGFVVPKFELGTVCEVTDIAAHAQALERSLQVSPSFELSPRAQRFTAFHTEANYRATWTRRARERLGLPPERGLVTWDDVTAEDSR